MQSLRQPQHVPMEHVDDKCAAGHARKRFKKGGLRKRLVHSVAPYGRRYVARERT